MSTLRYAVPRTSSSTLQVSRIIRPPAAPATGTLTPAGLDRTATRALGALTVTSTPLPVLSVALQGASNTSQVTRPVPAPFPPELKNPGPAVFVFVYSAPPIFNVIVPGSTNQGYKFQGPPAVPLVTAASRSRIVKPAGTTATSIGPAGLQHTRTLGSPQLNPTAGPAGQTHTRTLGSPSVQAGNRRALGNPIVTIVWIPRPDGLLHTRLQGDPTIRGRLTITLTSQDHTRDLGIPTLSGRTTPAGLLHTRTLGTVEVNLITVTPVSLDRV